MATIPQNRLVQHYAHLGDLEGIATLVTGVGYQFRAHDRSHAELVRATDPRLTLAGHVSTADQQWQADLDARAPQEMSTTGAYKGFTLAALRDAFALLCDPADWCGPIAALVPGDLVMLAVASIEFFTATHPTVALDLTTMQYLVESIGYRRGPAGDH